MDREVKLPTANLARIREDLTRAAENLGTNQRDSKEKTRDPDFVKGIVRSLAKLRNEGLLSDLTAAEVGEMYKIAQLPEANYSREEGQAKDATLVLFGRLSKCAANVATLIDAALKTHRPKTEGEAGETVTKEQVVQELRSILESYRSIAENVPAARRGRGPARR